MQREDEELTKRIYNAQKNNPSKGDWIEMVQQDFKELGIQFNDEEIMKETKVEFKLRIRNVLGDHMFKELKRAQQEHSKISSIIYKTFKVQDCLKTHMMNNHELALLFALRSRTSRYFKTNFPFYTETICPHCGKEEDSQEHCMKCEVIYPKSTRNNDIEYSDIFNDDVVKQSAVTHLVASLIERGEDASASDTGPSPYPAEGIASS